MVKVYTSGRSIRPDGTVQQGEDTVQDVGEWKEVDNLVNESQKLSAGHLVVNDMQKSFDLSLSEYQNKLSTNKSGYTFEDLKKDATSSKQDILNQFWKQGKQDGLNGDLVNEQFNFYADEKLQSFIDSNRPVVNNRTREEFFAAYKELHNSATHSEDELLSTHASRINNLLHDAGMSGAFSKDEINHMQEQSTTELFKGRIENLIERDPHKAIEVLDKQGKQFNLPEETVNLYRDDAVVFAKKIDEEQETNQETMLRLAAQKKLEQANSLQDAVSRQEYLDIMKNKSTMSTEEYERSKLALNENINKKIKYNKEAAQAVNTVLTSVKTGGTAEIANLDPKVVAFTNDIFIADKEKELGRPLNLEEQYGIAKNFRGQKIDRFSNTLSSTLIAGTDEERVKALEITRDIIQNNPLLLDKIPQENKQALLLTIGKIDQLPENLRTPENMLDIYKNSFVVLSKDYKNALKMSEKELKQREDSFNRIRDFNISNSEYNDWVNKQKPDEADSISLSFKSALRNHIKEFRVLYPNASTADLKSLASQQIKTTSGVMPGDPTNTLIPFEPTKEFGEDAVNLIDSYKYIYGNAYSQLLNEAGIKISPESAQKNMTFVPLNDLEKKNLPLDKDGNPTRQFMLAFTKDDGQLETLLNDNGQPLVVGFNKNKIKNASEYMSKFKEADKKLEKINSDLDILFDKRKTLEHLVELNTKFSPKYGDDINSLNKKIEMQKEIISNQQRNFALDKYANVKRAGMQYGIDTEKFLVNEEKFEQAKETLRELEGQLRTVLDSTSKEDRQPLNDIHKKIKEIDDVINTNLKNGKEWGDQMLDNYKRSKTKFVSTFILPSYDLARNSVNTQQRRVQNPVKNIKSAKSEIINIYKERAELLKGESKSLMNEYNKLRDGINSRGNNQFDYSIKKVESSISILPNEVQPFAKSVVLLPTTQNDATPITSEDKAALERVSTTLYSAGVIDNKSSGKLLRAASNEISSLNQLSDNSRNIIRQFNAAVSDELINDSIKSKMNPFLKALKKTPDTYNYLSRSDNAIKRAESFNRDLNNLKKSTLKSKDDILNKIQSFNNTIAVLQNSKSPIQQQIKFLQDQKFEPLSQHPKELERISNKRASRDFKVLQLQEKLQNIDNKIQLQKNDIDILNKNLNKSSSELSEVNSKLSELNRVPDFKSMINNLQDVWLNVIPQLDSQDLTKANEITELLNELQFQGGTKEDINNIIKEMSKVFGLDLEITKDKKRVNFLRRNR